uniref:Uncharacterized protein n=1 Tax=Arundo donax TaxID=35708 RepID=A0A0A9D331_ARUDO
MRQDQRHRRRAPSPGRRAHRPRAAGHARPTARPAGPVAALQSAPRGHPPRHLLAPAAPVAVPAGQPALRRHPRRGRQSLGARAPRAVPQQPLRRRPVRAQQPDQAPVAEAGRQPPLRRPPEHQHPPPRGVQRLVQRPQRLHPQLPRALSAGVLRRQPPPLRQAPPGPAMPAVLPVPGALARRCCRPRVEEEKEALWRGGRGRCGGRRGGCSACSGAAGTVRGSPPTENERR